MNASPAVSALVSEARAALSRGDLEGAEDLMSEAIEAAVAPDLAALLRDVLSRGRAERDAALDMVEG